MQIFVHMFIYARRKQAKQIQEQLKVPQNGKSYSLKASSTMAKSENLVKSHVQLQNVSDMSTHLLLQPTSVLPVQRCWESGIRFVYIFRSFIGFCLNRLTILGWEVCTHACMYASDKRQVKFQLLITICNIN